MPNETQREITLRFLAELIGQVFGVYNLSSTGTL